MEKAQRIGETWDQTYPRAGEALPGLGMVYQNLGKYDKSVAGLQRAVAIDPFFAPAPVNLAWGYLFLERYADAERTFRQAAERNLTVPDLLIVPYLFAFYRATRRQWITPPLSRGTIPKQRTG